MSNMGDLVGSHLVWVVQLLMITKRMLGGLVHPEKIEEMDKELTKVIEDFDCTVNVEALHLASETNIVFKLVIAQSQSSHVELVWQDHWLKEQLKPVETSYNWEFCCMDGTCRFILDQIITWVTNGLGQGDIPQSIPYWIYSFPGIGKTSLAHSICERLDERKQFAGLTCSCKSRSFTYIIPSYII